MWQRYRKQVIILVIVLVTTQSTQTYLCAFMLLAFYLLGDRINMKTVFLGTALTVLSFVAYTTLPFLREKINEQLELTADWEDNLSLQSPNRFTTTMLDIYYIKEHLFIGNTDDPERRYGDHFFVMQVIENQGVWLW